MFQKGDKVFYPYHGAGLIQTLEDKDVSGEKKQYFIIRFSLTETTIMVPMNSCAELGLRALSEEREIKRCFEILRNDKADTEEDWKIRYKKHQDMLKSGRLPEIVEVIKNLYDRNRIKGLSSTEKKVYDSAFDMAVSEISLALDKEREIVKAEVLRLLDERHSENTPK